MPEKYISQLSRTKGINGFSSETSGYEYVEIIFEPVIHIAVQNVNEDRLKIMQVYCSVFGCGKELTLIEKLAGNKCIDHQSKKPITFNANY